MIIPLYKCPYCGNTDIYTVWPDSNFDLCRSCLLYFRNPMPTENELRTLYEHSWSMPEAYTAETGGTDDQLANIYARSLARSLGKSDLKGLRILDFGAGRGAMLNALSRLGARACAVEPFGYAYLRSKGFEEVFSSLSDVRSSFDGIIMIDVLEHLYTPWEILAKLRERLVEGGWFYIATGNPLGLNARLMKGKWREARKKEHLLFPSPSTMERMLIGAGFRRFQRLKWYIRYHPLPRGVADYVLQATGLDGELRYLAWS